MGYRWYHLPCRAVLLAWALGKSVLGDWFPPHTCRNCEWSRDKGFTTLDCTFGCGEGYGRPVWPHDVCGQWQKKRGLLPENHDIDEELARIEEEGPDLGMIGREEPVDEDEEE